MPIYEFRCPSSHLHELNLPMQAEARSAPCPECGADAARLISSPRLSRLGTRQAELIGSTEASAHAPAVVDHVPGAGARRPTPVTSDPRHARLPRP
ncbi:zinc ribbon domain-containing protein [Brachybacterium muris]|uniref:FmdB family zinc ribbon protein n=1 Tax=Brachybacterium muris TaxID=219301 RepID=UPI00223AAB57|nr:zinc ribbon domain-containing protein [Brachybacterium muris]MCT2295107.1 zinc ribbon domain-containing protein [Brachybacterium muris]